METRYFPVSKLIVFGWLLISLSACKKSDEVICQRLASGVVADDKAKVGDAIEDLIASLPSKDNTIENFNRLIDKLSQQCGVKIVGNCFNCVYTLPAKSEIRFSVNASGTPVTRTIDIS